LLFRTAVVTGHVVDQLDGRHRGTSILG
jgi:hypothetical protein